MAALLRCSLRAESDQYYVKIRQFRAVVGDLGAAVGGIGEYRSGN